MKIVIWIVMILILVALIVINDVAMQRKSRNNQNMLQYIAVLKTFLSDVDFCRADEHYKLKQFFTMYNTGTKLEEDPGKIEFQEMGEVEDYYM